MNNVARVFATGIIWGALTILGVAMMVTRVEVSGGMLAFVMTILIIGATIGTSAIWRSGTADADVREQSEKSKRSSRVERLMSDLDERDIDELRFRLMGDNNDEKVSLEELMQTGKRR
jgi:hypothetical protein